MFTTSGGGCGAAPESGAGVVSDIACSVSGHAEANAPNSRPVARTLSARQPEQTGDATSLPRISGAVAGCRQRTQGNRVNERKPGLRPGPHQGALPLGSPPRAEQEPFTLRCRTDTSARRLTARRGVGRLERVMGWHATGPATPWATPHATPLGGKVPALPPVGIRSCPIPLRRAASPATRSARHAANFRRKQRIRCRRSSWAQQPVRANPDFRQCREMMATGIVVARAFRTAANTGHIRRARNTVVGKPRASTGESVSPRG